MNTPKYPNIKIRLVGESGNAYSIIHRCMDAMRKANVDTSTIALFYTEVTSGNYDHLLQTVTKWFSVGDFCPTCGQTMPDEDDEDIYGDDF